MKTEQEQIEKMAGIIAETLQHKRVENSAVFVTYLPSIFGSADREKEVAETLVQAGYGDVSEYKAEIERLKSENKSQERENDFLKYCQCLTHGIDGSNHIKKAQIDVLNKLKEKYGFYSCYSWHCDTKSLNEIIDELIKEIENAEDKG